jgi:hypothetical protein
LSASLNVVETILNFAYVYLAAVQQNARLRAIAPIVGFSSVIMTFWKTALYWMQVRACAMSQGLYRKLTMASNFHLFYIQDYLGGPKGWSYTGHNKPYEFFFIFALPNSMWLIVPAILSVWFGLGLAENLLQAAGLAGPAGGTRSRAPRKSVTRRKSSSSVASSAKASKSK